MKKRITKTIDICDLCKCERPNLTTCLRCRNEYCLTCRVRKESSPRRERPTKAEVRGEVHRRAPDR